MCAASENWMKDFCQLTSSAYKEIATEFKKNHTFYRYSQRRIDKLENCVNKLKN